MVLTLQKLVHLHADQGDSDSETEDDSATRRPKKSERGGLSKAFQKMFSHKSKDKYDEKQSDMAADVHVSTNGQ
jgi:hypothetical protein